MRAAARRAQHKFMEAFQKFSAFCAEISVTQRNSLPSAHIGLPLQLCHFSGQCMFIGQNTARCDAFYSNKTYQLIFMLLQRLNRSIKCDGVLPQKCSSECGALLWRRRAPNSDLQAFVNLHSFIGAQQRQRLGKFAYCVYFGEHKLVRYEPFLDY